MRYAQALNSGLSGLMQSIYAGRSGKASGQDDAYKQMMAESQIGNNEASAGKAMAESQRLADQREYALGDVMRQKFAEQINSPDPVQRSIALQGMTYLTPNVEQYASAQDKVWDRGDLERATTNPDFRLSLNGAQAAQKGSLFDSVGDTGYVLNQGTGGQSVGNQDLVSMFRGKVNSEIGRNNRPPAAGSATLTLPQRVHTEGGLRDDYRNDSKNFVEITRQSRIIKDSLRDPSAAGTLAAATSFMKMLDPGSVVRESELGMAMQSTGSLDRFMNYTNVISSGKVLTASQKEEFGRLADQYLEAANDAQRNLNTRYSDIAVRNGLDPRNVIMYAPPAHQDQIRKPKQPTSEQFPATQDAAAQQRRNANKPKAVQWLKGRNIQTQDQFRAAVQSLRDGGWSASEIQQIQQEAGL